MKSLHKLQDCFISGLQLHVGLVQVIGKCHSKSKQQWKTQHCPLEAGKYGLSFCFELWRNARISYLSSQNLLNSFHLLSYIMSLCMRKSLYWPDISDNNWPKRQCWKLEIHQIKIIIAMTASIVSLNSPFSLALVHKTMHWSQLWSHNCQPMFCPPLWVHRLLPAC